MARADRDEDLRSLLDDLETTLSALRDELDARDDRDGRDAVQSGGRPSDGRTRRSRRRRTRTPPRPPSLSELFGFTERYTIPTLIAMLEATIQSLELLGGVLRLADPERSALDRPGDERDRSATRLAGDVGRGAVSGVERALSELRTALSETDLPDDEASQELLAEARRLSEEVADRLAETRRAGDAERYYRGEESAGPADADRSRADRARDDRPRDDRPRATEIDVEAELESIRDEVDGRSDDDDRGDDDRGDDDGSGEAREA
ncbi:MAG: hypothetical protein ABEK02_06115 [Haloquadratum sp.]